MLTCDCHSSAGMAELADAADSKSAGLRPLGVQVPLPAPPNLNILICLQPLRNVALEFWSMSVIAMLQQIAARLVQ